MALMSASGLGLILDNWPVPVALSELLGNAPGLPMPDHSILVSETLRVAYGNYSGIHFDTSRVPKLFEF